MMERILEISDLVIVREGQEILNLDQLNVYKGETLAVIGPNGAGKSTLLLALSRLLEPVSGLIKFRGQPIEGMDDLDYRRQLALVLQSPLLLDKSVYDNVAEGLRYRRVGRGEIDMRVKEWLGKLGVEHLSRRSAGKLSGGEAQRVSLARAFAIQPQLLLLDEPFSALDAPTRARLLEDFQALLAATDVTTIFITHDLDEALFLGERVAVLLEGKLRQVGRPQDVFSAPSDPGVAAFVGVETIIAGRVSSSLEGQITIEADGLQLEAIGELTVGREVLACLRPEDVTLLPHSAADGGEPPPQSSARNCIKGYITRMIPQGPLVKVVIDCGFVIVALITRSSAEEMSLNEGKQVYASFKASGIHLIPR